MRLPRDLSGRQLAKALGSLGYVATRQAGSHIRLSTDRAGGHRLTIPDHPALRTGTLAAILRDIEQKHGLTRQELFDLLFGP